MRQMFWLLRVFLILASGAGVLFCAYLFMLFSPSREHQIVALAMLAISFLNGLYLVLHDRA